MTGFEPRTSGIGSARSINLSSQHLRSILGQSVHCNNVCSWEILNEMSKNIFPNLSCPDFSRIPRIRNCNIRSFFDPNRSKNLPTTTSTIMNITIVQFEKEILYLHFWDLSQQSLGSKLTYQVDNMFEIWCD